MTKTREQVMQEIQTIVYSELSQLSNFQNLSLSSVGYTIQSGVAAAIAKGIDHALHTMTHDQFEQTFGLKD